MSNSKLHTMQCEYPEGCTCGVGQESAPEQTFKIESTIFAQKVRVPYNLFLDDLRTPEMVDWITLPQVNWFTVRNYSDFVYTLKTKGVPRMISFDHDLSIEDADLYVSLGRSHVPYSRYRHKTGKDCAEYLVEYCLESKLLLPEYLIHSKNQIGAIYIQQALETFHLARL